MWYSQDDVRLQLPSAPVNVANDEGWLKVTDSDMEAGLVLLPK